MFQNKVEIDNQIDWNSLVLYECAKWHIKLNKVKEYTEPQRYKVVYFNCVFRSQQLKYKQNSLGFLHVK